ncbi:MAG TPA: YkgJ family cysteine cluster protein [Deltaproteobacteria bacterium]|jgi:Fe-S-cluster containining protein|nr:YkgJ family cysteine cluster protein [Deltaproteobacteria bacterium]HOI06008.1 YkgJ family cysteine cluster protein [Deltaproteobacteria bacterium]
MDALFRRAASLELKTASGDLSRIADIETCTANSYRRYDEIMARVSASLAVKTVCRPGCSWCCHFKVEVRAHELFLIWRYIRKESPNHEVNRFLGVARSNAESTRSLSRTEHFATNLACPFLLEDTCRIYPVRPFACRNFHATTPYNCRLSFENPMNLSIPSTFIPELHSVGTGHKTGYERALEKRGFDMRIYDMSTAFLELHREESSRKRFLKGKRAFLSAVPVDVDDSA